MKRPTKKHFVTTWANTYRGLGPDETLPQLPIMPRPPRPGHVWTADGQEILLVRAVWFGQRAADLPLTEELLNEDEL